MQIKYGQAIPHSQEMALMWKQYYDDNNYIMIERNHQFSDLLRYKRETWSWIDKTNRLRKQFIVEFYKPSYFHMSFPVQMNLLFYPSYMSITILCLYKGERLLIHHLLKDIQARMLLGYFEQE